MMNLQADAYALPFKDNSVDCVVTSPPYFGCEEYGTSENSEAQLGTEGRYEDYVFDMVRAFNEVYRVLKSKGTLWLILGDLDDQIPIVMAPQRVAIEMMRYGWILVQEINWVKPFVIGAKASYMQPQSTTEKVYMFTKSYDYTHHHPVPNRYNVWECSPAIPKGLWAELPKALVSRCIAISTNPGDVVLDPFAGSGTVPKVAEATDRIGIGSELFLP